MVNEEMVGSVDVLAFTPLGYRPTSRFVEGFLLPIASSMVVATLLALVLAWQMSKRNQRYIKGIQQALSDLAHGRHGVTLPQSKIVENLAINASIGDLDRRLEKNDASRREWLNSISHDLATPVTSMKLMLDGMVEGMFPLNQETMAGLKKECDDLAERIDRVVFYANLTSPTTKADLCTCDIAQMIDEVKQSLDEGIRERTCFIQKATTLVGDRKLLERAIGELVRNAAQASSEEISVCIGEGTITVMNDGILPPDTDFFEPWTKGDKSRTGGGNGLGLPIVGQILRLHQGSAHLSQHKGKVLASLAWPIA